ncbi:ATP-binding protein [Streptacidiphilus sp. PAMC 29251]
MSNADQPQHPQARAGTWLLDGLSGTAGTARHFARTFLDASRPPLTAAAADDVLLAVSELVTNAVRHAPGPCTLRLADHGETLLLSVSDTSTVTPTARRPDLERGGGFGWHLLHTLAHELTVAPDHGGKTIRAVLPSPRSGGGRPATPPG